LKNLTKLSIVASMAMNVIAADVEINNFEDMFKNGVVSGQIEAMYSGHQVDNNVNPYSTAIGGQLMYKTASLSGFSAAVEFTTVHEIGALSGNNRDGKRATMLIADYNAANQTTTENSYTELSQAFLEYTNSVLNVRLGRQLIDTPLADSDDIRIVNNTFEAYIASYEINNFSLMGGMLLEWQGTDAGLDTNEAWQDMGKDGTFFGGISYGSDLLDASVWYYDISEAESANTATGNVANQTVYVDTTVHAFANDNFSIDLSAQYLTQNEEDNSGIDTDIYGLKVETSLYDLGLVVAYNDRDSDTGKSSFSGFGGGTLFTNMDNMIIDTMSNAQADVLMFGVTYDISDFNFYAMAAEFNGDLDINNAKEEIIEINLGFNYAINADLTLSAICTINDDKENTGTNAIYTGGDFENYRLSVAYAF